MTRFYLLRPILSLLGSCPVQAATPSHPVYTVEVFTTKDQKVQWETLATNKYAFQNIDLQVYALGGIQILELALSKQLPVDLEQAKQIALQRIQQLDAKAIAAIQQTAIVLIKSLQYGLNRYPAFVLDRKAVMFGMTDLESALEYYSLWLSESQ